jgi:hypothetical protein
VTDGNGNTVYVCNGAGGSTTLTGMQCTTTHGQTGKLAEDNTVTLACQGTGLCVNGSLPVTHSDGLGHPFQDCTPRWRPARP